MPQLISSTDARESFAEIINRVFYSGEEFIVQKRGKPVIKIVKVAKSEKQGRMNAAEFLSQITKYGLKSAPSDLAGKHDEYAWK